jgi:hypothetical protein
VRSNSTNGDGHPSKRLPTLIVTFLLSTFLLAALAPSAFALPANFFGFQYGPQYLTSEPDLEAVGRSGAKYWRFGIDCSSWYGHESSVWSEGLDTEFRLAWEHGVQVLPVLSGRCQVSSGELPQRNEWSLWESFAKAVVTHYGYTGSFWQGKENKKEVEVWEIQNEPNLGGSGWDGLASGAVYAEFFKRASEALHAAQGTFFPCRAMVGGLYYVHSDTFSRTPHTFMQEMANSYPAVVPWIDGVGIHPYEWGSGAVASTEADINSARNDVSTFFGSAKTLWITEIGWNVEHGEAAYNNGNSFPQVNEAEQSSRLTELFNWVRGAQESKKIQALICYNYRDFEYNQNPWWTRAGLRSGVPGSRYSATTFRPAWYAFQSQTGAARWPIQPAPKPRPQRTSPPRRQPLTARLTPMAYLLGITSSGPKAAKDFLISSPLMPRKPAGGTVISR